jgi:uncharacterized protein
MVESTKNNIGFLLLISSLAFLPTIASVLTDAVGQYGVGLTLQVIIELLLPIIATGVIARTSIWQAIILPLKPTAGRVRWTEYMGIGLALLAVIVIMSAYYIFRQLLDLDGIRDRLMLRTGVTAATYPWVAFSVAIINPFLEEYFWRGFIYRNLSALAPNRIWHVRVVWLAGLLFALHHTIIIQGWFVWWQWIIVTVFLALVGVMFNWLYEKSGSILISLMVHMAADITLAILGLSIFGIIHV